MRQVAHQRTHVVASAVKNSERKLVSHSQHKKHIEAILKRNAGRVFVTFLHKLVRKDDMKETIKCLKESMYILFALITSR